jgi:hypothetical protein
MPHKRFQVRWIANPHGGPTLGKWEVWDSHLARVLKTLTLDAQATNVGIEDARKEAARYADQLEKESKPE